VIFISTGILKTIISIQNFLFCHNNLVVK
jgi:hypothetical protein